MYIFLLNQLLHLYDYSYKSNIYYTLYYKYSLTSFYLTLRTYFFPYFPFSFLFLLIILFLIILSIHSDLILKARNMNHIGLVFSTLGRQGNKKTFLVCFIQKTLISFSFTICKLTFSSLFLQNVSHYILFYLITTIVCISLIIHSY